MFNENVKVIVFVIHILVIYVIEVIIIGVIIFIIVIVIFIIKGIIIILICLYLKFSEVAFLMSIWESFSMRIIMLRTV